MPHNDHAIHQILVSRIKQFDVIHTLTQDLEVLGINIDHRGYRFYVRTLGTEEPCWWTKDTWRPQNMMFVHLD